MFICHNCSFETDAAVRYLKHVRAHSNENVLPCGVPHCKKKFRTFSAFTCHVSRYHRLLQHQKRLSYLQNVGIHVKCNVESCQKTCHLTEFLKHLKGHIDAGIKVNCPVSHCGRSFINKTSFTSHISRKHCTVNKINVRSSLLVPAHSTEEEQDDQSAENETEGHAESGSCVAECATHFDPEDKNVLVRNLALFFLKLQCRHNISSSTVQVIATEMFRLHQMSAENSLSLLKAKLEQHNVNMTVVNEVISEFVASDVFQVCLNAETGILRSHHKRRSYYKQTLHYVEPVQKYLGRNAYTRPCHYQYVPVQETLTVMLQDDTVAACVSADHCRQCGLYQDICDGDVYQDVSSTVHDALMLEIILYQDSFEIVNPLGSAKKVHKVVAVYMALGNLPSRSRTHVDNLQLVMLCREVDLSFFGIENVFECLLKDLKCLETTGLVVNGKVYKSRVICVLGDNLGSHWLGGFCTNFSSNSYVCRYCLVERHASDRFSLYKVAEERTVSNYDAALSEVIDTTVRGIVCNSVLNSLTYFHVCMPGLPPCLGHDIFEGIVQYDVPLILKRLCTVNKDAGFSYAYLNRELKRFKFIGTDARDKPGVISQGHSLGGHAVQNWCLLRLLPILLHNVVCASNEEWQLLLLLREIVELVCAPKITLTQILYLSRLVMLYIEDRLRLFPHVPLRPKHHYLLHYPWLITKFGPLIHVWTLRMESKHSFFKRCIRSTQNFINANRTLAETHQLKQALIASGAVLFDDTQLGPDCMTLDSDVFAETVITAVSQQTRLTPPLQCSSAITVSGTRYSKGLFVVTGCSESLPVFAKVTLCVMDSTGLSALVVHKCKGQKNGMLGVFEVEECEELMCVLIDELWDYCPVPGYCLNGVSHVALKHAVFSTE